MSLRSIFSIGLICVLTMGCGASKTFVEEQIQASEARTQSDIAGLRDKTDANASEVNRLRSLADQLSDKTDLAINAAKGFEDYVVLWTGVVNFDFDAADITATAEQILMEAGDMMTNHSESIIEIAGHTDMTGAPRYNLMLGEQRANSAKRFLIDKFGVSLYRLFVVSYGEANASSGGGEQASHSADRRVALTVWGRQ